ncbi:hypothetical protein AB0D57_25060 [Streptomyces sp. NPDC048275]|uniref:hypothetical protein n=1 Tax=Streptomyces sp. NPDC048275 TaxID=3155629 RepID=UPI0033EB7FDB
MDSTHTARRRRPEPDVVGRSYAELTDGRQGHPPIYAQLVAEWHAKGRVIPERREVFEVLWASFAASGPLESELWPVDSWADGPRVGPPARSSGPERERAVRDRERAARDTEAGPVPAIPVPRGLLGW